MKKHTDVPAEAALYLAAMEEYFAAEILEKASLEVAKENCNLVRPEHILNGIKKDKALKAFIPKKFLDRAESIKRKTKT